MTTQTTNNTINVVILCARFEEAKQVRNVFEHNNIRVIERSMQNVLYHTCSMIDKFDNIINIQIHTVDKMGSVVTAAVATRLLESTRPHWLIMTGVCAGNPAKGVSLGDLIVAERILDLTAGKLTDKGLMRDLSVHSLGTALPNFLQNTVDKIVEDEKHTNSDGSDHEQGIVNAWHHLINVERPISDRYKKELFLEILLGDKSSENNSKTALSVREIKEILSKMEIHLKDGEGKNLLDKLVETSKVERLDSGKYQLTDLEFKRLREHYMDDIPITSPDHTFPKIHTGVLGCYPSTIKSDLSPEKWKELAQDAAQRNLIGLEMESMGLFDATKVYNDIDRAGSSYIVQTILVKGVSDLADPEKDDQFHDYGKQISAAFIYKFLLHYGHAAAKKNVIISLEKSDTTYKSMHPAS